MSTDLAIIFFTSLAATLNPALLAAVIVIFLLPHPKRLMLGYLAGAYATSIAAGLAIVFSLRGSGIARTSSHLLSPGQDIAAGALALATALALIRGRDAPLRRWHQRRKAAKARGTEAKQPWQQRMLGKGSAAVAFAVGAVLSFPGVAYLSALHRIAELNLPAVPVVLLIAYFCLMQQITLELALLALVIAPQRAQAFAVRSRAWLSCHRRGIAVTGLAGIGALLLAHGLTTIS
jgi:Sap, sulfolipid-1-addressing protein